MLIVGMVERGQRECGLRRELAERIEQSRDDGLLEQAVQNASGGGSTLCERAENRRGLCADLERMRLAERDRQQLDEPVA